MAKQNKIMVTRASMPPFEEYEALIRHLWDTHFLTNMGEYHEELKEELRRFLQTAGLELFVNGHMALEMALQAFSLQGEVITTPFTFSSTVHAIVRSGLKPVLCDVRETDGTMDAAQLERLITAKTTAIVPVHVYGNVCDTEAISAIAKKHGLKVIYDAAHAFGEEVRVLENGKPGGAPYAMQEKAADAWHGIGTFGDAAMFSFHATKVFNTIEGGAVSWNCAESAFLKDRLYQLKNFGITGKESVAYVGGNAKMNEFSAAMGICNLRHVRAWIEARKKVCMRYRENLKGVPGVRLMPLREDVRSNYAYMPVVLENGKAQRDAVYEALCRADIYPRKYFYPCVNDYDCYQARFAESKTPAARYLADRVLTLPLYPELEAGVVDEICSRMETALRQN